MSNTAEFSFGLGAGPHPGAAILGGPGIGLPSVSVAELAGTPPPMQMPEPVQQLPISLPPRNGQSSTNDGEDVAEQQGMTASSQVQAGSENVLPHGQQRQASDEPFDVDDSCIDGIVHAWTKFKNPAVGQQAPTRQKFGAELGRFQMKDEFNTSEWCKITIPQHDVVDRDVPSMMAFIAEHLWGLKRPELLVSVTGGAQDFALSVNNEEELLQGLMGASKRLEVWFVTGGSDCGIMKYVGEARHRYAAHAPLIGIAPWKVVAGKSQFQNHCLQPDNRISYPAALRDDIQANRSDPDHPKKMVGMNPFHSHFFFVDTNESSKTWGAEIKLRSDFESAVISKSHGENMRKMAARISKQLQGQQRAFAETMREKVEYAQFDGSNQNRIRSSHAIPAVCICVQGGMGSVGTVLEASQDTPVFLVKGTGNASDLLADFVTLGFAVGHKRYVPESKMNSKQIVLHEVLNAYREELGVVEGDSKWPGYAEIATSITYELQNIAQDTLKETVTEEDEKYYVGLIGAMQHYFPKKCETRGELATNLNIFKQGLQAAATKMCWVYDLDDDTLGRLDFTGSLLRCVLNGQRVLHHPDQPEAELFLWQLRQCLQWGRADVLENVIAASRLSRTNPDFQTAMDTVACEALGKDSVAALAVLLKNKASLRVYALPVEKNMVHSAMEAARCVDAWVELFDLYDSAAPVKRHSDITDFPSVNGKTFWDFCQDGVCECPSEPGVMCCNTKTKLQSWYTVLWQRSKSFQADVRRLLGSSSRYNIGEEGYHFDLLIWSVMMNRKDMADLMWQQCPKPVRAALTVCILYRTLVRQAGLEPMVEAKMVDGAALFERYAVGIQKTAMEEDLNTALDALEEQIPMWDEMTLLDIAILGKCRDFTEACVRQAVDRRFRGDLDPYTQSWGPFQSFLSVCLVCIASCGFLAPQVMKFNPPPLSENTRFTTQRRVIPDGFPHDVKKNDKLMPEVERLQQQLAQESVQSKPPQVQRGSTGSAGLFGLSRLSTRGDSAVASLQHDGSEAHRSSASRHSQRERIIRMLLLDSSGGKTLTPGQLNELWEPTFDYWEKFFLFWKAPAVLFLAGAIVLIIVVGVFTNFMLNTLPTDTDLHGEEGVILIYFCSFLLIETTQCAFNYREYFLDLWNWMDWTSCVCFIAGFYAKTQHPDASESHWKDSIERGRLWYFFYSFALAMQWMRLLRVLSFQKEFGILVITVQKMLFDIARFGVIWVCLLMGFAVMMRGATNDDKLYHPDASCASDNTATVCWNSFFLIKVFFQSMGEFFHEDIMTDAEVVTLFMLFVVLNILLLNLLIAIMSNTYEEIKDSAEVEYLIDMWGLTREYSRTAIGIPPPLNIPSFFIDLYLFVHHIARSHTTKLLYGDMSILARLRTHFARNLSVANRLRVEIFNLHLDRDNLYTYDYVSRAEVDAWLAAEQKKDGQEGVTSFKELKRRRAVEVDCGALRDAFVERCRSAFLVEFAEEENKDDVLEHLEHKVLREIQDVEDRSESRIAQMQDQHERTARQLRHIRAVLEALAARIDPSLTASQLDSRRRTPALGALPAGFLGSQGPVGRLPSAGRR